MSGRRAFHLAIPVEDLSATRAFYVELIGCRVGREADTWIDFDFFGNQISAHLKPGEGASTPTNEVDGDDVPVRHFGAVLEWNEWHRMVERLRAAEVRFLIEPHVRFAGRPGEQATLFFTDPTGHALEFKAFRDPAQLFASLTTGPADQDRRGP